MADSIDPTDWRAVANQQKTAVETLMPSFGASFRPIITLSAQYVENSIKALLLEKANLSVHVHQIDYLLFRLSGAPRSQSTIRRLRPQRR